VPRAGLTTGRVVEVAAEVADETGWETLSLAAVAERCGVRLPSLYKHVRSLDAVRLEVSALAIRELGEAVTAAVVGRARADAVHAMAAAWRGYARAHPGRYAATRAAPRGDHDGQREAAAALLAVVEATLAGYGLRGDDAVDATRALRAALHGFVDLEVHDGFGLPVDVDRSFTRLVSALERELDGWS
jgi:AcrR family transcriptional regulator